MNYKNDIQEIIDFINCDVKNSKNEQIEECLLRFTMTTGEDYLDARGENIRQMTGKMQELNQAFQVLSSYCEADQEVCNDCVVKKYCNYFINQRRKQGTSARLTMVDLFCGAGGLSLGFSQEGFVTILANDIEECCIDTYAHNHPEVPRKYIVLGDIREVVDHLEDLIQGKNVDIVVGGPHCQGFSMANRQRLIDDPRNYLYKNYVEVVKRVEPKFFVMENVKGMFSVAEQVRQDFKKIGYDVSYEVLNAKDFGVPQNRERLIYIGNRIGVDNKMIFSEIHEYSELIPEFKLKDALYGLRELEASRIKNSTEKGSEKSGFKIEPNRISRTNQYVELINSGKIFKAVCNHKARYNNDRDIEIYGRMNPVDKSDDPKIADIMPYSRRNGIFRDKYYKLEPDRICKTITAHMKFDCNMYIHPTEARGLTPREAARVQSYPDDYFFKGAYTKTYMQIGNSVPPLLGKAIAHIIKKHII